jgi:low affinity Fe/Cu permease
MRRGADETIDDPRVSMAVPADRSTRATRAISKATAAVGSFPMMLGAVGAVAAWLLGGLFVPGGYGNTSYQLPVSTVSSIVTFLMVFVIQSSQNRDTRAMQAKLDAQADVLAEVARKLGVEDHEYLLTRLAGLEDAPDREIDAEQARVRRGAAEIAHVTDDSGR